MSTLENIERLKKSQGMQSRKVFQMNSVAKYLASRFSDRCATTIEEFFKLCTINCVFGKLLQNDFVTVEKVIPSTFQKCINNAGR